VNTQHTETEKDWAKFGVHEYPTVAFLAPAPGASGKWQAYRTQKVDDIRSPISSLKKASTNNSKFIVKNIFEQLFSYAEPLSNLGAFEVNYKRINLLDNLKAQIEAGNKEVIPFLNRIIESKPGPNETAIALEALGYLGEDKSILKVLETSQDPTILAAALWGLNQVMKKSDDPETAARAILGFLKRNTTKDLREIYMSNSVNLGQLPEKHWMNMALTQYPQGYVPMHWDAIKLLALGNDPLPTPKKRKNFCLILAKILNEPNTGPLVKSIILEFFGANHWLYNPPEVIFSMKKISWDQGEDPFVRMSAQWALRNIYETRYYWPMVKVYIDTGRI